MEKGTRKNIIIASTYAAALLLGLMLGQFYIAENQSNQLTPILPISSANKLYKVQNTVDLIFNRYVDSINMDSLEEQVIGDLVSELDPHSEYMTAEEAKSRSMALEGTFDGIGVEYFSLDDTILAIGLVPGGPAHAAGLKVGDRLVRINGRQIAGEQLGDLELEKLILGKRGSALQIHVIRNGLELPLPIKVVRDKMEISTIDAAYLIEPGVAFIKIKAFGAHTVSDFKRELDRLMRDGARKLILDLRGNRGGYFSSGVELANQFLEAQDPIVYTEGAHQSRTGFFATEGGIFTEGALVVLIDEESASATEIVAGALQDHERAIIIGRPSFGKGLVQERFTFGDGAALNLTVARYYTPLGRGIQKARPSRFIKSKRTRPATPEGFRTASGKVLFADGGIRPDLEMAIDSVPLSPAFRHIYTSGSLHEYVYRRLAKGAPSFSIESFLEGYFLSEPEYDSFLTYLKEEEIVYSRQELTALKAQLRAEIEAILGRYYFGNAAYYKIKNRVDPDVIAAVGQLSGPSSARGGDPVFSGD